MGAEAHIESDYSCVAVNRVKDALSIDRGQRFVKGKRGLRGGLRGRGVHRGVKWDERRGAGTGMWRRGTRRPATYHEMAQEKLPTPFFGAPVILEVPIPVPPI